MKQRLDLTSRMQARVKDGGSFQLTDGHNKYWFIRNKNHAFYNKFVLGNYSTGKAIDPNKVDVYVNGHLWHYIQKKPKEIKRQSFNFKNVPLIKHILDAYGYGDLEIDHELISHDSEKGSAVYKYVYLFSKVGLLEHAEEYDIEIPDNIEQYLGYWQINVYIGYAGDWDYDSDIFYPVKKQEIKTYKWVEE